MKSPDMTSSKPYLIRALYAWITDNGMIPHLVAKVNVNHIKVPLQYAQNNQITLNISHTAALNLQIDNDYIMFSARFSGVPMNVVIPTFAVLAIYAKETGAGMVFDAENDDNGGNPPPPLPSSPSTPPPAGKPHLKLVKS